MRSIMESNLNYWDEVIVINKFVSDVIHLYPLNQYWYDCKCILKNWDDLSVHNFEYFKKVVTYVDSPTYRYKYGNAEKILHHEWVVQKTPEISKEFWHYRVRINRIISEHSRFYAIATQQIF